MVLPLDIQRTIASSNSDGMQKEEGEAEGSFCGHCRKEKVIMECVLRERRWETLGQTSRECGERKHEVRAELQKLPLIVVCLTELAGS